ncbi:hypothetical protein [Pseudomonas sp. NPDC089569]|uniref:hypothetical protein n=1 Tax=Pseudomonas sp. NPDC089569 TaxID=3390722 RepID=UPI003D089029
MSNVSYLDVKPEMAAKALAADNDAKREFFEKVVEFSKTFSVKETSRLLKISVGWLRDYAADKGITFPDPLTRSKEEQRAVNRQFEKLRPLKELRKVEPVARALPGQLQLTPELEVLSRRALRRATAAFHKRVTELAEVFSLHEAAEILNVGVRYLKNFGYEWDIQFCGEQRPYTVSVADAVIDSVNEVVAETTVVADVPAVAAVADVSEIAAVVSGDEEQAVVSPISLPIAPIVSPIRTKNPFVNAEIRFVDLGVAAPVTRPTVAAISQSRNRNPFVHAEIRFVDLGVAAPVSTTPAPIVSPALIKDRIVHAKIRNVGLEFVASNTPPPVPIDSPVWTKDPITHSEIRNIDLAHLASFTPPPVPIDSPVRTQDPFAYAEIRNDDLAVLARISRYPMYQPPTGTSYSLY